VIKLGASGEEVIELQNLLHRLGYGLAVDGVFGLRTLQAVQDFQTGSGLVADGIVGTATKAALPHLAKDVMVSANFNEREFACRHCGLVRLEPVLLKRVQALRDVVGRPVVISSAYRCPVYNKKIGGAPQSKHMLGQAVDIVIKGMTPAQVAQAAAKVGFTGIGIYRSGFTHVDIGPRRSWNG